MKTTGRWLGLLGGLLTCLPMTQALQWTTVEAVLRPLADGAMPAAERAKGVIS
jgi:hypothetical protein